MHDIDSEENTIVIDFDPEINELIVRVSNLRNAEAMLDDDTGDEDLAALDSDIRVALLDNVRKEINLIVQTLTREYNEL
jgi:hypothetical protein